MILKAYFKNKYLIYIMNKIIDYFNFSIGLILGKSLLSKL